MLRRQARVLLVALLALLLAACGHAASEASGWRALQSGMELSVETRGGPRGQDVLSLLYTIPVAGGDYAIERRMPVEGWQGRPALAVLASSTRVLFVAVVLVDREGREYECARTLLPAGWRELQFDFQPGIDDWADVVTVRFVDRTGGLGGQGPVSLKLIGLPL